MSWQFEAIAKLDSALGGLAWTGRALLFSVPNESRIASLDPGSGVVSDFRRYTNRTNGLALARDGSIYGTQEGGRRIVHFTHDGSTAVMPHLLDGRYHNHPNNLFVDAHGSIWFTDPHSPVRSAGPQIFPPLDHASVLRLDHEEFRRLWDLRRVTFDTRAPRAVAVSPDEKTLYVAETDNTPGGRRELRAYRLDQREVVGAPRVMHTFGEDHRGIHRGIEGLCLDSGGNIIACAGWGQSGPGPMLYVFAPDGEIVGSHRVPADMPVNCAFGGADLSTLYVTTAAGALFAVRDTGLRGVGLA
ncbi:MAG: gluconolactonase [Betaproteobacteria bacterium]|jgi:gluconolactonase|nr:gluconolactonase [Betaproteobacteria bacterium]